MLRIEIWDGQAWRRLPEPYNRSCDAVKEADGKYLTYRIVRVKK